MSRRRTLIAAALATAAAVAGGPLAASPALAGTGGGTTTSTSGPSGRIITTQVVLQRGVANGNNTRQVEWTCAALTAGDVVATSVNECSLRYTTAAGVATVVQATRLATPTPASATAGFQLQVPMGVSAKACVAARATFLDSSILSTPLTCTPLEII